MARGIYVALMGIDGSGKTTVTQALETHAKNRQLAVANLGSTVVLELARERTGCPWGTIRHLADTGWDLYTREPTPESLISSAALEVAAQQVVRTELIEPALAQGTCVVADSFAFKGALKALRAAGLKPGEESRPTKGIVARTEATLSHPSVQPDLGLYLDADPAVTFLRRITQAGQLRRGDMLPFDGGSTRESFVRFQSQLAEDMAGAAERWGWTTIRAKGQTLQTVIDEAIIAFDTILSRET